MDCMAYDVSHYGRCKVLNGIDRLLVSIRGTASRPVATMAPKVNP